MSSSFLLASTSDSLGRQGSVQRLRPLSNIARLWFACHSFHQIPDWPGSFLFLNMIHLQRASMAICEDRSSTAPLASIRSVLCFPTSLPQPSIHPLRKQEWACTVTPCSLCNALGCQGLEGTPMQPLPVQRSFATFS